MCVCGGLYLRDIYSGGVYGRDYGFQKEKFNSYLPGSVTVAFFGNMVFIDVAELR